MRAILSKAPGLPDTLVMENVPSTRTTRQDKRFCSRLKK
jgi:hypothetical protein